MSDIALVTCRVLPEPDPDEALLLAACQEAGLKVVMAAWDDPRVDWNCFRIAVLRSCWNYYEDPQGFRAWLDRVAQLTTLWNPHSIVCENLDKRYLLRLVDLGVPIVPTHYLTPELRVEEVIREVGWDRFVIKPTISAGSYMTRLFSHEQVNEAQRFACSILESREALIQPYMASVERGGEVAMVHIDGEFTHCVLKDPRFTGSDEAVSVAFQPDASQAATAATIIATVADRVLYARVDLMKAESGEWLLSELELVEPSLFFLQHQPALDRFIAALARM